MSEIGVLLFKALLARPTSFFANPLQQLIALVPLPEAIQTFPFQKMQITASERETPIDITFRLRNEVR
ncbi:hypothetical protein JCM10512_1568 [Bacteroides reticulotermitis JCM 10512]|uniref:Uncharacterized protein n=1 Tax=Bacteroides reticulotermitis JCM 10512 TaxID=1445607 RepID=W4UQ49_9BACE|nr:hypothetical protein JCM10512_1568 [Bacteroides reticulotermitis JCM 10512]